jgi:hypothetical protein
VNRFGIRTPVVGAWFAWMANGVNAASHHSIPFSSSLAKPNVRDDPRGDVRHYQREAKCNFSTHESDEKFDLHDERFKMGLQLKDNDCDVSWAICTIYILLVDRCSN